MIYINGWAILAHALFLDQMERLVGEVEAEKAQGPKAPASGNAKLLAHLLDLAFDKIPADPGNAAFRHGGTLGADSRHWFRGKTGNGRYRLFYRFHSGAKIIVFAWVNDEESLRTYSSNHDAYAVFAAMLRSGNPPDDWDALVRAASQKKHVARTKAILNRGKRRKES
ncbi:MAG: type II toxin-antitoxin system YhaV family toxin [Gemmatimonadota bacterium]